MNNFRNTFISFFIKGIVSICLLIFSYNHVISQKKDELKEKRQKTLEEIQYANKILKETKKSKTTSIERLALLNKRISLRQQRINNITNQINNLNKNINTKNTVIQSLRTDLKKIKEEYAYIIKNAYKYSNKYKKWMFILAAEDFNQAFKRINYLKQITKYRKEQVYLIKSIKEIINDNINELKQKRNKKKNLISEKIEEREKLITEKNELNEEIEKLKQRESELRNKIERKREIAEKLKTKIKEIIRKERKKAKSKGYKKLTPEDKLISDNFTSNKGRLPWPTRRGVITSKFGRHKHPVLDGVYVQNNGIDISTVNNAQVRSIFKGTVSRVFGIKGSNYTVIIRHGNFLSVYQNIVNVKVKKGETVEAKQVIGKTNRSNKKNSCTIHFELWKETDKLNPKDWIASR